MSDLISRQALLKLFENLRDEHETNSISYVALYEVILQQPTAYDVEKVIEKMEKKNSTAIETLGEQKGQVFIRTMNLAKQMVLNGGKE